MPEMSFNKRIKLVKNGCFAALTKEDLSKTANSKSGYYSLESIFKYLNPLLEKYELDLDILELTMLRIHMIWYDDLSDNVRECNISTEKIKDVGRLPLMSNEVQSFGAILSYVRRYAYCVVLKLKSTDIIENEYPKQPEKPQNNQNKHIRYYYAIFNKKFNKNTLESKIDPLILKIYNVKSKNNIPAEKLNELTKWADKKTPEQILDGLEKKSKSAKK
jgi:hypothetical protein